MLTLVFTRASHEQYENVKQAAEKEVAGRKRKGKSKSAHAEGLFRQLNKALRLLAADPRHPGLRSHAFKSLEPIRLKDGRDSPIFESYVQNDTPSAYRIFWAYGPEKTIVIVAITPHS